ncbi:MAG: damage-inducible protein CinA, partial [Bacteroidales bacterium]|nr:damage-inducible protein CinA [Bacteroidales bacterium]
MNSSLINIGDELLIGQVVNTNAAKMSQMLGAAGIEVAQVITIGDDAEAIRTALTDALRTSEI